VHQIAYTNSLSLRDCTLSTQQRVHYLFSLFFDLEISSRTFLNLYVAPAQFSCFYVKLKRLTDTIVWGGGCFSDAPRAVRLSSPVSSMVSSGARSGSPQCRCSHFTSETSCAINATREQARHRTHTAFPLCIFHSLVGEALVDPIFGTQKGPRVLHYEAKLHSGKSSHFLSLVVQKATLSHVESLTPSERENCATLHFIDMQPMHLYSFFT
jgi:hypothetical protein